MLQQFEKLLGLKKRLDNYGNLSLQDYYTLFTKIHLKKYSKGEIITQIGQVERNIYFVINGLLRHFSIKDSKEISVEFFFSGDVTSSYTSFIKQQNSLLSLQAISDCQLAYLSYTDLQTLYNTNPIFINVARQINEELFIKSADRVLELLTLSAKERYEKLFEDYPSYVAEIPQKYLASYLNITQESLSRIRRP